MIYKRSKYGQNCSCDCIIDRVYTLLVLSRVDQRANSTLAPRLDYREKYFLFLFTYLNGFVNYSLEVDPASFNIKEKPNRKIMFSVLNPSLCFSTRLAHFFSTQQFCEQRGVTILMDVFYHRSLLTFRQLFNHVLVN